MCGFAFEIPATAGRALAVAGGAARAVAGLARRGPDGTTIHQDQECGLVFTRLVQWNEGRADQPWTDGAGGLGVFNGEVFNLAELQHRLALPHASEIEVLVTGVRRHGPGFAALVDGQFAAVVRQAAGHPFHAFRDRFGICPLYLRCEPDRTLLGSNLAAVQALSGQPWSLNPAGLGSFLADWASTGEGTVWAGVRQCPPGHVITVRHGRAEPPSSYFASTAGFPPAPTGGAAPGSPLAGGGPARGAVAEDGQDDDLRARFEESVRRRLRSVGDVACLVSGGIDSTLVSSVAARAGVRVGLALTLEGESVVAARQRHVAEAVGLELIQHRVSPAAVVAVFEDYVRTRRIPLVRLGPVGMTALARRARAEGLRAVLSGEGADELFCGYDSYRLIAARQGNFGDPADLPWDDFGAAELGTGRSPRWNRGYWRTLVALTAGQGHRADILRPVASLLRLPRVFDRAKPKTLAQRRADDLGTLLGNYLLTVQADHAWSEEGVELRPPFLGQRVADWALARDPAEFVGIEAGKLPVWRLLRGYAAQRPALSGLDFPKAAFRVDLAYVLRSRAAGARLRTHLAACPDVFVDTAATLARYDLCLAAGACSEAESMLFTFAASLGLLAGSDGASLGTR